MASPASNPPLFHGSSLFRMEALLPRRRSFALVLMDLDASNSSTISTAPRRRSGPPARRTNPRRQLPPLGCRARYGGDEFVILMPETSMEQARSLPPSCAAGFPPIHFSRKEHHRQLRHRLLSLHGSMPQELIQSPTLPCISPSIRRQHRLHRRQSTPRTPAAGSATFSKLISVSPSSVFSPPAPIPSTRFTSAFASSQSLSRLPKLLPPLRGRPRSLPQSILDTVTSLAYAIDPRSVHQATPKRFRLRRFARESLSLSEAEVEEFVWPPSSTMSASRHPRTHPQQNGPLNPEEWTP